MDDVVQQAEHGPEADVALRSILHSSRDVLLRGSCDGTIEWVTPSVTRCLGWASDALVGTPFVNLVHPFDRPLVRATQEVLDNGEQRVLEVRLRTVDGSYRWTDIAVQPVIDAHGVVTGRLGRLRDIHAEVAQRERLDQTLQQLRASMDAMLDPYVVLAADRDATGVVVDFMVNEANDAACRYMSATRVGLIGAGLHDVLTPDVAPGYLRLFTTVLEHGEPVVRDAEPFDNGPGGARRYYDFRVTWVDVDRVAFTWRDATDRVDHQQARADLASIEALAEERDRMARDLHDGAVQQVYATGMLLESLAGRVPEDCRTEIERVIDIHDDVIRQVRATILGLARPDLSTMTPAEAVAAAVAEAERGLRAALTLRGHEQADGIANPLLLEHLLFSLREMLSNVARHAQASTVQVSLDVDSHGLTLTVTDDGVGLDETASRGYGLSNLAKRAALLSGDFTHHQRPGGGTVARWTAPLSRGGGSDWSGAWGSSSQVTSPMHGARPVRDLRSARQQPITRRPSCRAACPWRRSNVQNARSSIRSCMAAARWSESSERTPTVSAMSAARLQPRSSSATSAMASRSRSHASRARFNAEPLSSRARLRRTSTSVTQAVTSTGSASMIRWASSESASST